MVQSSTYDRVIALVRLRTKVAVLLHIEDDPLCSRSLSLFSLLEGKMQAMGYQVMSLAVDSLSSHYEEVSCARVPQLRLFTRGRCHTKITGLMTYEDLDATLDSIGDK